MGNGNGDRSRGWSPFSVSSNSSSSSSSSAFPPRSPPSSPPGPPQKRTRLHPPLAPTPTPSTGQAPSSFRTETLHQTTLTLTLRRPPRLQVPLVYPGGGAFSVIDRTGGKVREVLKRQGTAGDFVGWEHGRAGQPGGGNGSGGQGGERDRGVIGCESEQEVFKVGEYLSYRFTLLLTPTQHSKLLDLLSSLGILDSQTTAHAPAVFSNAHSTGFGSNGTRTDQVPILSVRPENVQRRWLAVPKPMPPTLSGPITAKLAALDFSTRYLIQGLVCHGIITPFEQPELIARLEEWMPMDDPGRLGRVLGVPAWRFSGEMGLDVCELRGKFLKSLYSEERVKDIGSIVKKRAKQLIRIHEPPIPAEHLCKVYRCVVTPTRILLFPPEDEVSNTVLRKYKHRSERFLRVSFADEDDRIKMNPVIRKMDQTNESEGTVARVRRALTHGLEIAGRKYVFLAAGTSQAREHGCWFVSEITEDPKLLVARIRGEMGNIREKVVAKYAARLGLGFSTTREVKDAKGGKIAFTVMKPTKDVDRNGFTFTDGAGLCSPAVTRAAARSLGYRKGPDSEPSTIQVRIGGAKGVLTAWPWMVGYQYSLRPSMQKFISPDKEVNVIRISRFSYAFLNRQFIVLMNELGISAKIFLDLFAEAVKEVDGMAKRVVAKTETQADIRRADQLSEWPVRTMLKYGFNRDPCLQDLLRVIECRTLSDLRWRARLEIKQGVYLLGIPDELEILKEGEVFCQYRNPDDLDDDPKVVTGLAIICRAPALHPGDIRRVKAVDRPELHHLRNVIVFSTRGQRDLPNMLGGGDLDGDDYSLIWDPRLIHNYDTPPMDYSAPPPKEVAVITAKDLQDNFVDYLKNDILGQVDNAHLAWAAHAHHGPRSDKCLKLAEIHSTAVDFAKTGHPAEMPTDMRPDIWPDFMGKDSFMSYRCDNVLGQLFRVIEEDPVFKPCSRPDITRGLDQRLCRIVVPQYFLKLAGNLKVQYDLDLWHILLRYRITEAEAYSGMVLKNNKRRKMKDNDLKDPIRDAFQEIVRSAHEEGTIRMGDCQVQHTLTPTQLLAVACYQVTYDDRYEHYTNEYDESDEPVGGDDDIIVLDEDFDTPIVRAKKLISFAWLYGQELLALPVITGHAVEID